MKLTSVLSKSELKFQEMMEMIEAMKGMEEIQTEKEIKEMREIQEIIMDQEIQEGMTDTKNEETKMPIIQETIKIVQSLIIKEATNQTMIKLIPE
jgi:hypothetical protein